MRKYSPLLYHVFLPLGSDGTCLFENAVLNRARKVKTRTPACTQTNTKCVHVLTSCVCVLMSLPGDGETEHRGDWNYSSYFNPGGNISETKNDLFQHVMTSKDGIGKSLA